MADPGTRDGPEELLGFPDGLFLDGGGVSGPPNSIMDGGNILLAADGSIFVRKGFDIFETINNGIGYYEPGGTLTASSSGTVGTITGVSPALNTLGIEDRTHYYVICKYKRTALETPAYFVCGPITVTGAATFSINALDYVMQVMTPFTITDYAFVWLAHPNMVYRHGDATDATKVCTLIAWGRRLDKVNSDGSVTVLSASLSTGSSGGFGWQMRAHSVGKTTYLTNYQDPPMTYDLDGGLSIEGASIQTTPADFMFLFGTAVGGSAGVTTDMSTSPPDVLRYYGLARLGAGGYGNLKKPALNSPVNVDATGTSIQYVPSRYANKGAYLHKGECPLFFSPDEVLYKYTTGTVETTANDATVTGSGTLWKTGTPNNVVVGDIMCFPVATKGSAGGNNYNDAGYDFYYIVTVTDDTHVELDRPVRFSLAAGSAYYVLKNQATLGGQVTVTGTPFGAGTAKAATSIFPVCQGGELLLTFFSEDAAHWFDTAPRWASTAVLDNVKDMGVAKDPAAAAYHVYRLLLKRTAAETMNWLNTLAVEYGFLNRIDSMWEVSLDGGTTWYPIVGHEEADYYNAAISYTQATLGNMTVTALGSNRYQIDVGTGGFDASQIRAGVTSDNWFGWWFADSIVNKDLSGQVVRVVSDTQIIVYCPSYVPSGTSFTIFNSSGGAGPYTLTPGDRVTVRDFNTVYDFPGVVYVYHTTTPAGTSGVKFRPQCSAGVILSDRGNTPAGMKGNVPYRMAVVKAYTGPTQLDVYQDGPMYAASRYAVISGRKTAATYGLDIFRTKPADPAGYFECNSVQQFASPGTINVGGCCAMDTAPESTKDAYAVASTSHDPPYHRFAALYLGVNWWFDTRDRLTGTQKWPALACWSKSDNLSSYDGQTPFEEDAQQGSLAGFFMLGEQGFALKTDALFSMPGDEPRSVIPRCIDSRTGCVAPMSICVLEGVAYWMSRYGFVMFDGSRPVVISQAIRPWIARLTSDELAECRAVVHDQRVLLTLPYPGLDWSKAVTVAFDPFLQKWMPFGYGNGLAFGAVFRCNTFHDSGETIFFSRRNAGSAYQVTSDKKGLGNVLVLDKSPYKSDRWTAGAYQPMSAWAISRRFTKNSISLLKIARFLDTLVQTQTTGVVTTDHYVDYGDGTWIEL